MLVLGVDVIVLIVIALVILLLEYIGLEFFTTIPSKDIETVCAAFAAGLFAFIVCYCIMAKILDMLAGGMWLP